MILYRPVGLYEMEKILDSNGKEFPERFKEQPIFYPVINIEYARQIASEWNTEDSQSGYVGYVTSFEVDDEYIANFQTHQVGGEVHREYWIPAEKLSEFNENIIGNIEILEAHYGPSYIGIPPLKVSGFKEENVDKQFDVFEGVWKDNRMDFSLTAAVEWKIINLNYFYWLREKRDNDILIQMVNSLNRNSKRFIRV